MLFVVFTSTEGNSLLDWIIFDLLQDLAVCFIVKQNDISFKILVLKRIVAVIVLLFNVHDNANGHGETTNLTTLFQGRL